MCVGECRTPLRDAFLTLNTTVLDTVLTQTNDVKVGCRKRHHHQFRKQQCHATGTPIKIWGLVKETLKMKERDS